MRVSGVAEEAIGTMERWMRTDNLTGTPRSFGRMKEEIVFSSLGTSRSRCEIISTKPSVAQQSYHRGLEQIMTHQVSQ